jgi:pimeloyl-ACP methyl ester carboxylesterase
MSLPNQPERNACFLPTVENGGIRRRCFGEVLFAYRRFGNPAGTPLVFLQHFRGSMDNWDPALLNCFAKDRLVITFDNAGVGFSSGEVPDTVAAMALDALDFLDALGLTRVDLLGFSLGAISLST